MTTFPERKAYLLAGLPGSGKSTAAEILELLTGGDVLRAGEMIREMARNDGLTDPSSHELGEYASQLREEEGPGFFAEKSVGMILRGELDVTYPLIVDSVRHINGVNEFSEFFDTTELVWMRCPFQTRLERMQDRGREGEGEFSEADLIRRDKRELHDLGTETILHSDRMDRLVGNTASEDKLESKLATIVNDTITH